MFALARMLGRYVSEIERQMTGVELAEWDAFLQLEGRVQQHIARGVTPELAERMVWSTAPNVPVEKRRVKGKG